MIRLLTTFVLIFYTVLTSLAYTITGRIVDSESQQGLHHAIFLAKNNAGRVVVGVEADGNGRFTSADVLDSILSIQVYHESYDTLHITLQGLPQGITNLGDIRLRKIPKQLDEVAVTASAAAIQGVDKFIVYPSTKEITSSGTSLNLLSLLQYRLPGLQVVESLNQVTIYNQTPEYMINGRKVDLSRVLGLNNSNILRVEYYDNPQMRFGEKPAINFILKPRSDGCSVIVNANTALTTISAGGSAGFTYFKGKSEWNINYGIDHRSYNNRRVDFDESYRWNDVVINRIGVGQPAKFTYTNNSLSLDYTFMPTTKTMFAINVGGTLYRQYLNDIADISQIIGQSVNNFSSDTHRRANLKSPSADLYFRHQIRHSQTLEVNSFVSYNNGDYLRDYDNQFDQTSIESNISNNSWRAGVEAKYSIGFKNATAYFGLSDSYNHSYSRFLENADFRRSRIGINNLFVFSQLSGRLFNRLSYTGSIGLKSFQADNDTENRNATRAKGSLNLSYKISGPFTISYMFLYDPSMPNVESQNEIIQSVNDIEVRKGNQNIKPSELIKNQLRGHFMYKSYVALLTLSHSRTVNPVFYEYSLITDASNQYHNHFLSQNVNGKYNENFTVEGEVFIRDIASHFNFGVVGGWSKYNVSRQSWNDFYDFGFAGVNLYYYLNDFSLSAQYTIAPFYSLSGNIYSRPERWNTVSAQYKYHNWYFRITAVNLFTKRGSLYNFCSDSPTYSREETVSIRNCANMIMLGITYRTNFGKIFNKGNRTLHNEGVDSGVNMSL